MLSTDELINYLNDLLQPELFKDYSPNGLQISGKESIQSIITGVSACQDLLDEAVDKQVDAVLVHHGFFWQGEDRCLVRNMRRRVATLIQHDINLIAYHLPLDAHAKLGNNAQLGQLLGIESTGLFGEEHGPALGWTGQLARALSKEELSACIAEKLHRVPLCIAGGSHAIKTLAWCTGAAQSYLEQAIELGVDAYVTGEISEHSVHKARENNIHLFAAGHHATERYGVKALGEHLADKFSIDNQFIDIDNPV